MSKLKYRPEIDGLRAIAVLPVIFFHAGFAGFEGGYIGVDVFFVISGYLITSIILKEKQEESFTLFSFYERRARRILPALSFVMLFSIVCSWILMSPLQMKSFGLSLIATSTFWSNLLLFKVSNNYFAGSGEINPLLHTWTLSVEEQFYLFYPLFLLVFWKHKKLLLTLMIGVAFLSIVAAQWSGNLKLSYPYFDKEQLLFFKQSIYASFYLPLGRVWELILGAIAGFYLKMYPPPPLESSINSFLFWDYS